MRPFEVLYEKVLFKSNMQYYSGKTEFHGVKYFSKTVPRKMDSRENNEVVNHFKACCSEVICIIFSSSPRSMSDAQLIAPLLIRSDWSFPGTLGRPGTCCSPSATTAAAMSALCAPRSTTRAAPTTRGPPRAGGGRLCTLGSCTFAGKDLLLRTMFFSFHSFLRDVMVALPLYQGNFHFTFLPQFSTDSRSVDVYKT